MSDDLSSVCRHNLLTLARAYAKAKGISVDHVSKQFYGNGSFLRTFKSGAGSVSIAKFDGMIEAFKAKWPEKTPWPPLRIAVIRKPDAVRKIPR